MQTKLKCTAGNQLYFLCLFNNNLCCTVQNGHLPLLPILYYMFTDFCNLFIFHLILTLKAPKKKTSESVVC